MLRLAAIRRSDRSLRSRRGATFVDLVIAVLVIGILAAAGVPRMSDALHRNRASAAAQRIRADLRWARQRAMSRSTTQIVRFTAATHSYTLVGVTDLEHSGQPYNVTLSESPYESRLVSIDAGGDAELVFDHFGQPDSQVTIIVASGAFQRTVTVDSNTGLASVP